MPPSALRAALPHPRRLLEVSPDATGAWPAVRIAATVALPLAVLTAADRTSLAVYAVFGAMSSVYGRAEGLRARLRSQATAGLSLVAAVALGALLATAAAGVRPWLAVACVGLVAAAGSAAADALGWRPAGPLFLVFALGATSSAVPAAGTAVGPHVATAAGVAAASAVVAVALGALGALAAGGDRSPLPAVSVRPALADRGVRVRAARCAAAAVVAGLVATAAGMGHPYWASLTAVVPMAAADTHGRLLRAAHRLVGTAAGLVVAAALLALSPSGWALVALVALAQLGAELFVLRNYSLALVFITPLALLMNALGGTAAPFVLVTDRAVETLLGIAVGVAATLLRRPRS